LGLLLAVRLVDQSILYYVNQRFLVLSGLGAVGLLVVGAAVWRAGEPSEDGAGHHDEADGHAHSRRSWVAWLLLLCPIILGFLVPPRPHGSAAIANREFSAGGAGLPGGPDLDASMGLIGGERNVLDWLREFQSVSVPAEFEGQPATVVGFVYRDERFAEGQFLLARFVLSCCVADAAPVGLVVQTPEAGALPADQWLEVSGRFAPGALGDEKLPVLIPEEIKAIEPPRQPYLYG
jgi:uncharacterized repeat protein (TIGR03943 family)